MNAKALRLTAFAAASLCLIASSPAQDDASLIDLESVVVKGSRSDQLLLDTPNSITIIDRQTIQESGITNLRDIDDFAPNVSINQIGQVGGNFISIRGIESNPFIVNRTAVYIDGIPFREPDTVNIRNAEQIEILRGPQ
ncbi:MAG: TonB-dependent receptor plug domain-containing protein, partial [Verrucomicrobiota bacterium]